MAAVVVAGALVMSGCGTRASDQEIIDGLRAAAAPAGVGQSQLADSVDSSSSVAPDGGASLAGSTVPTGAQGAPTGTHSGAGTAPAAAVAPGARAAHPVVHSIVSATSAGADVPKDSAAIPGANAPTVVNKLPIRIGTLGSFSGVIGAVTEGSPKSLGAWVGYTNAHGGLGGHPIKLIVADDQGDAATSLTLAKRLVETDHIVAMVANVTVFGFSQVEEYARAKNIPLIGGDAVDGGWTKSTVAFPVSPGVSVQVIQGLRMMINAGIHKLGMLYCLEVSAVCTYLANEAQKSDVGRYLLESTQVSLVAPSYTSQCLRLKQEGVQAVSLVMDTAGAARVAKDCATQGYQPKIMLLSIDATKDMPRTPGLESALIPGGTVSPAARGVPGLDKYREVMRTYGSNVGDSGFGLLAYAAGELLLLAAKNLSDNPAPGDLFQGLWQIKNETLGGLTVPLTFAKGQPPAAKPCIFVWGVTGGHFSAPQGAEQNC
ncbi:MAG TPA: ABC transporter substrate-binding protein [Sporichthyaceae bacterium]